MLKRDDFNITFRSFNCILTSNMADRDEGDEVAGDGGAVRGCPKHPQR